MGCLWPLIRQIQVVFAPTIIHTLEVITISKQQLETDTEDSQSSRVPWIPGLKKPVVMFKRPDFALPTEAPQKYVLALLLFFTVFLLAGGIYNLAENPLPMGQTEGGLVPVFKLDSEQFLIESIIAGLFIALGAAGLFLVRYSTRFAYDARTSLTLLSLGIVLVIISLGGILVMYDFKMRRP